MSRTALRKKTPKRASFGQARPATWDNGTDLVLRGYWLNDTKPIRVEVPIFQHAFHPKLSFTDLDIRQNIAYRTITIPSLSTLRTHGIEVERAAVIVEIVVHPRHIRNYNYFRGDFPALVKGIAKRDNTAILLPANDIPSARMKRKKALGFLRASFTPLMLKGRHYTTGRMGVFMATPPGAVKKFQSAFNFGEEKDEKVRYPLREWHPQANAPKRPRKRGPKPMYSQRQQRIAAEIIAETSEKLRTDLFPIVADKLQMDKTSAPAKELEHWLGQPATSRELIKRTRRNGRSAVKTWVNQVLAPKVKEIAKDEAAIAVQQVGRWVIRQMIAASAAMILDIAKDSWMGTALGPVSTMLHKISLDPSDDISDIAGATLSRESSRLPKSYTEQRRRVYAKVEELYMTKTGEHSIDAEQLFTVRVNPRASMTPVSVSLKPMSMILQSARHAPLAVGSFADDRDPAYYAQYIRTRILPGIMSEVNDWYKKGMPEPKSGFNW